MNKNQKEGKITKLGLSLKTKYLRLQNLKQVKKMREYNIDVLCVTHNMLFDYNKLIKKNIPSNVTQISRLPFANGFVFLRKSLLYYFKLLQNENSYFLNKKNFNILKNIQKINDFSDKKIMKYCLNYNLKNFQSVVFSCSNLSQIEKIDF